jgi:hypothetical protein
MQAVSSSADINPLVVTCCWNGSSVTDIATSLHISSKPSETAGWPNIQVFRIKVSKIAYPSRRWSSTGWRVGARYPKRDTRIAGLEWRLPPLGVTEDAEVTEANAAEFDLHPGYFAVSIRFVRGNQAGATDGEGGHRFRPLYSYKDFQPVAEAGYSNRYVTIEGVRAVWEPAKPPKSQPADHRRGCHSRPKAA